MRETRKARVILLGIALLFGLAIVIPLSTHGQSRVADPIGDPLASGGGGGGFAPGGGTYTGAVCMADDIELQWGSTCGDYWIEYDSGAGDWAWYTTDSNGAGLDGVICKVDDGTDDLDCTGTIDASGVTVANNFILGAFVRWTGETELSSNADGQLEVENNANTAGTCFDVAADGELHIQDNGCAGETTVRLGGMIRGYTGIVAIASPYSTLATDFVVGADSNAGAIIVDLTSATVAAGRTVIVKDVGGNATTLNITVTTAGAETIDGIANYVLDVDYESVSIVSDGSDWFVY